METDNALLATAQSKIEELENKISNQNAQLAKYEETQESLFKDKKNFVNYKNLDILIQMVNKKRKNNKS